MQLRPWFEWQVWFALDWIEAVQITIIALKGQMANLENQLVDQEDQLTNLQDQVAYPGEQLMSHDSQLGQVIKAIFDENGNELFFTKAKVLEACILNSPTPFDYTAFGISVGIKTSFCSIKGLGAYNDEQYCSAYRYFSEWRAISFHDNPSDCRCEIPCVWLL